LVQAATRTMYRRIGGFVRAICTAGDYVFASDDFKVVQLHAADFSQVKAWKLESSVDLVLSLAATTIHGDDHDSCRVMLLAEGHLHGHLTIRRAVDSDVDEDAAEHLHQEIMGSAVRAVAHGGGNHLAVGCEAGDVCLFEVVVVGRDQHCGFRLQLLSRLPTAGAIETVALSSSGRRLAVGRSGAGKEGLELWAITHPRHDGAADDPNRAYDSDDESSRHLAKMNFDWQHRPFAYASPSDASGDVYAVALLEEEDGTLLVLAGGADGSIVLWRVSPSTSAAKMQRVLQELLWHSLRAGPITAVAISQAGLVAAADDYEPPEGGPVGGTAKFLAREFDTGTSFDIALRSSRAEECINPSCDTSGFWTGEWRMNCLLCSKLFPLVNALAIGSDGTLFFGGYGKEVCACKDLCSRTA